MHQFTRSGSCTVRKHLMTTTVALFLALVIGACGSLKHATDPERPASPEADSAVTHEPGPAELWAWNCARCHGMQPPSRFSDDEWSIVMQQMRLHCYLTGEEQRAIEQFLRSANN